MIIKKSSYENMRKKEKKVMHDNLDERKEH